MLQFGFILFFIDKAFGGLGTERKRLKFIVIKVVLLNEHKKMGESEGDVRKKKSH